MNVLFAFWVSIGSPAYANGMSGRPLPLPPRCVERAVPSMLTEGTSDTLDEESTKSVWFIVGVSYFPDSPARDGQVKLVDEDQDLYWDQQALSEVLLKRAWGDTRQGDEIPTLIVTPKIETGTSGGRDRYRAGVVDAETFYTCLDYALQRADTNDHFFFYFVGHGSTALVPERNPRPGGSGEVQQYLYLTEDLGKNVIIPTQHFSSKVSPAERQHPIQFRPLRDYIMYHAYGGEHARASSNAMPFSGMCPSPGEPLQTKGRFKSVTFILDTCQVRPKTTTLEPPPPPTPPGGEQPRQISAPLLCSKRSPLPTLLNEYGVLEYSGLAGPVAFLQSSAEMGAALQLDRVSPDDYRYAKENHRARALFTAALVRELENTTLELDVVTAFHEAADLLQCWMTAKSSKAWPCSNTTPARSNEQDREPNPQRPSEVYWWPLDSQNGRAVWDNAIYNGKGHDRVMGELPRLTRGHPPRMTHGPVGKKLGPGLEARYLWERDFDNQKWMDSPPDDDPMAAPALEGLHLHRADYPRRGHSLDENVMASRTWLSFGPSTRLRTQPRPFQDARQLELSTTLTIVQNLGREAVVPQGAPGLAFSYYPSSKHLIGLTLGAQARYSRWGRIGTLGLEQTSDEGLFSVGTFPVLVALVELGPQIYLMRRVTKEGRSAPTFSLAAPVGAGLVLRDPPSDQSYYPPHLDWERSPALTFGLRGSLLLGAFSISLSPDLLLARESELLRTTPELTLSFGWTP